MELSDMQHLNMVCAKGLSPAENPPSQDLAYHAEKLYRTTRANMPWSMLSQANKDLWIKEYQDQLDDRPPTGVKRIYQKPLEINKPKEVRKRYKKEFVKVKIEFPENYENKWMSKELGLDLSL